MKFKLNGLREKPPALAGFILGVGHLTTIIVLNHFAFPLSMIKKLSLIFGSKAKAQEIIFLLKDVKTVARQGFYEEEISPIEQFCQKIGLFLVKSRFKVLLGKENNYSNKGIKIPYSDPRPGMYFVYISKDEMKAWLASYHELVDNVKGLGLLLGYPSCCVNFFCENFNEQRTDLELPSTNPWTNLSKREQDDVLLSHFPCRSDCQKSIQLAQKYYAALKEEDEEYARKLILKLSLSDNDPNP